MNKRRAERFGKLANLPVKEQNSLLRMANKDALAKEIIT
jgi:hypothetical protein